MDKQDLLKRGGESAYFAEFLKQEHVLKDSRGGGPGNNKMVTLQLPKIDPPLSKSVENLASPSGQSSPPKRKTLASSNKDASLDSSTDGGQTGSFSRAPIGSPVPQRLSLVGRQTKDTSDASYSPTAANQTT